AAHPLCRHPLGSRGGRRPQDASAQSAWRVALRTLGAQARSIVRQLRPHGLDHEVDERLRDVEVELSVGISCDLSLERPLASPGRKLLEVLARRLAKKRHL